MRRLLILQKSIYIYVLFFASLFFTSPLIAQSPPIIYVAGDGTGDYNCDGISDQIEINQALDSVAANPLYTTVFLKGNYKFVIDEPVIISSNTILTGDSTAVIYLKDSVGWSTHNKPVIGQKNADSWDSWGNSGDSISNVEIYGFEICGGEQTEPTGDTYIPLIHFYYPYNVSIHDMFLHYSYWDVVRMSTSTGEFKINTKVFNNRIEHSGHEGICFVGVTNFEAYNNIIYHTRTNSGIRAKDSDTMFIHHNIIGNSLSKNPSGYVGILIQNNQFSIEKAEIYENLIYGKNGGIHLTGDGEIYPIDSRKNVHIHHNRIFKVKQRSTSSGFLMEGGIKIDGFQNTLIEHNIIESGETDGIVYQGSSGGSSGYQTIVRNNIIINNGEYGISNEEGTVNTFIANNNLVYNNASGNYNNLSPTDDINSDPLYGSAHSTLNNWYHIVATYSNATETFKIYVNGKEHASEKVEGFGSIGINDHDVLLGIYRGIAYYFKGREDEMAIWNKALTQENVDTLYNNGQPQDISGSLTNDLQAYFKMENNWNDSSGNNYNALDSTAGFTTEAINGNYAGLFDGIDDGVQYPNNLSTANGLTISVWVYRTGLNEELQTILNKGSQSNNKHIWLYFYNEDIVFELGNGTERFDLHANVIKPEEMDYHVKSQTGRWLDSGWVQDTVTSPCVDKGDPATDYSNETEPNGDRVNIGVYGNTSEASKSKTNVYYVSTSGDDANSGTSPSEPWKTVAKVITVSSNFQPGDSILFKKGDQWNGERIKTSGHPSGVDGFPITYSAYGTGARPIINNHIDQSVTWTNESGDIWSSVIGGGERFFKNNIEMLRAPDLTYLGQYGMEYHTELINGGNNQKLTIYSTTDPANDVFQWSQYSNIVYLPNADFIHFTNMNFQGGASASIYMNENENWLIKDCNVGKNAGGGIKIKNSSNITIDSCTLDANNTIDQSQIPPDIPSSSYSGCGDGIFVTTGSSDISISNSYLKNWGHANFSANTDIDTAIITGIKFFRNELTSPDILYGGRVGYSGYSEDGEYFDNYIHNISVQNQLGGSNNHFHHNIIDGVLDSPLKSEFVGVGIKLSNYNVQVKNNIIENNVIANTESEGILIYSVNFDFPGEVTGNIIRNNIIYNCGQTINDVSLQFHKDSAGQKIYNNVIENNSIFSTNTTQTCRYQYNGTIYNVSTFNNQDDDIKDNISGDPLFFDAPNGDFHLQAASPCIDTGVETLSTVDYDGVYIPLLLKPDIGAFEYGIYWIGAISNDWHTAGNWSTGQVPNATDKVTIPSPDFYKFYPEVNSNAQIKALYLNEEGEIIIKDNVIFDVLE